MAIDNNDDLQRYLAHFLHAGKRPSIVFTNRAQLATTSWSPAVDVYETVEAVVVLFDLAGVDPSRIEVQAEANVLTVRGVRLERRSAERSRERRSYHALEIPYGRFERRIMLPGGADTEAAQADYRDGILEITLPKRVPRQVPISVAARVSAR
jgi:HSP20 family protein